KTACQISLCVKQGRLRARWISGGRPYDLRYSVVYDELRPAMRVVGERAIRDVDGDKARPAVAGLREENVPLAAERGCLVQIGNVDDATRFQLKAERAARV